MIWYWNVQQSLCVFCAFSQNLFAFLCGGSFAIACCLVEPESVMQSESNACRSTGKSFGRHESQHQSGLNSTLSAAIIRSAYRPIVVADVVELVLQACIMPLLFHVVVRYVQCPFAAVSLSIHNRPWGGFVSQRISIQAEFRIWGNGPGMWLACKTRHAHTVAEHLIFSLQISVCKIPLLLHICRWLVY